MRQTGFPGMKIMQFAFDADPYRNDFYYTNYPRNCVAYTGTHDNDTTRGWFAALPEHERERVKSTLGYYGDEITATIIDRLFSSQADTVIIPMQDYLDLDASARMNIPSTLGGNWAWRSNAVWTELTGRIRELVEKYGRE